MQPSLNDQAIKAALDGNWNNAVTLNQQILSQEPQNIPALNRLAKAYAQLGQTADAINTYKQVLSLDRFNTIAQKQCQSLTHSPCGAAKHTSTIVTSFIEEPGKTKTTSLTRLGNNQIILSLQPGQLVNMCIKNHWIAITTQNDEYIGVLADNLSFKLKQCIAAGNEYQTIVRYATPSEVSVFIKEIKRGPTLVSNPTF